MRTRNRLALAAAALVAAASAAVPAVATADDGSVATAQGCAAKFDEVQRTDMESFRDFDLATWVSVHDPNSVMVSGSGRLYVGIDAIVTALQSHFTNRNATWTWTELFRNVEGCKTATIIYDATYAIPSIGFSQRSTVSVVYTYELGTWLSVIDQTTIRPAA